MKMIYILTLLAAVAFTANASETSLFTGRSSVFKRMVIDPYTPPHTCSHEAAFVAAISKAERAGFGDCRFSNIWTEEGLVKIHCFAAVSCTKKDN